MEQTTSTVFRRAGILEKIRSTGKVQVEHLSEEFMVSQVTIRNDLTQLEKKGLLIRTRGGAIFRERAGLDYDLSEKQKKNYHLKEKIGKRSANYINDGDAIFLDSGTTTMEIAKNLSAFTNLTVITNALPIAGSLARYNHIKVIVPGGYLRENSLSLVGTLAEQHTAAFYCDKLFLGVDGFDSRYGLTTPNPEEAQLNRMMIEHARETIVVTDSSKFLQRSFAIIAPVNRIQTVITDRGIPATEKEYLTEHGIQCIMV